MKLTIEQPNTTDILHAFHGVQFDLDSGDTKDFFFEKEQLSRNDIRSLSVKGHTPSSKEMEVVYSVGGGEDVNLLENLKDGDVVLFCRNRVWHEGTFASKSSGMLLDKANCSTSELKALVEAGVAVYTTCGSCVSLNPKGVLVNAKGGKISHTGYIKYYKGVDSFVHREVPYPLSQVEIAYKP